MRRLLLVVVCSSFAVPPAAQAGPALCPIGLVWREALPNDHVCVLPEARDRVTEENRQAPGRRDPGPGPNGPDGCRQGFVWRDAFPGDRVCVSPETRAQAQVDNRDSAGRVGVLQRGPDGPLVCKQPWVWRAARADDYVCVTPQTRDQAQADNAQAAARRSNDLCRQGFVWRDAGPGDLACVTPQERARAGLENACWRYAQTASEQQQRNVQLRCRLSGDAWSGDTTQHFRWCLSANPAAQASEEGRREAELRYCAQPRPPALPGAPGTPNSSNCCWLPSSSGAVAYQCGPTCPCGAGNCR